MKRQRGFSLIEGLVAAAIFALISGAVVTLLYQSQRGLQTQGEFNQAGGQARIALDQIIRTVRHAGNDPFDALAAGGINPLEIVDTGHIRVSSDITGSVDSTTSNVKEKTGDPDGLVDAIYERVDYRFDTNGKRIMVDVGYGETVLADNIENLQFQYFDSTGSATTTSAAIARVRVLLVAATDIADPETGHRNRVAFQSDVFLRARAFDLLEEVLEGTSGGGAETTSLPTEGGAITPE